MPRSIPTTSRVGLAALMLVAWAAAVEAQTAGQIMRQAEADFLAGRIDESVAGFDQVARARPDAAPPVLAAGHRPLLRRTLRRLPPAVRGPPHRQPQRRRERRVALPVRRPRRVAGGGARSAAAGGARPAPAHARDLRDVPRPDDAPRRCWPRPACRRAPASTRISTAGSTTRRGDVTGRRGRRSSSPPTRGSRASAATCTGSRWCTGTCCSRGGRLPAGMNCTASARRRRSAPGLGLHGTAFEGRSFAAGRRGRLIQPGR